MAKKPSPQLTRILKQVLLLALPLILRALKNRKAQSNAGSSPEGAGVKVTDRSAGALTAKPAKARKRESNQPLPAPPSAAGRGVKATSRDRSSPIAELFRKRQSDVILTDTGTVVHLLPDDNEGSRHQRFLVEIDHCDVTIKIAHNIDLAPRVPVSEGDHIEFKGEYEWNELGGALHWTHHDPKKWREGGWIEHDGHRYE
ncbi:MAG: DUF3465 domain-containing protein [Planctomycetota bacterium]